MKYYKQEVENGYILISYKQQPRITSEDIIEITKEEYNELYLGIKAKAKEEPATESEEVGSSEI